MPRKPQDVEDKPVQGLAREIGKKRPFEVPEQESHLNLMRTASVLATPFERLFKAHGLSGALYNCLRILRGAGQDGRACHEVGTMMIAQVPDVTRIIDRLESMGLVERRRTEQDRRVVNVSITRKGLELLASLDEPTVELHRTQLGHLSRAELAEMNRLLVKARGGE